MSFKAQETRRRLTILLLCLSIVISSSALSADGQCSYIQRYDRLTKGMKVCWTPVDETTCGKLEGVFSRGACSTESIVGICSVGRSQFIYYEGNAQNIEIGCAHRKGKWNPRRKSSSSESSP